MPEGVTAGALARVPGVSGRVLARRKADARQPVLLTGRSWAR
jgi:hypothetical protein